MEVLDAERMREADRITIEEMRVPGLVLMENAGRLAAEALVEALEPDPGTRVLVFAGAGNNGGDGFVVARHLLGMGLAPEVYLIGKPLERLRGDAASMARAWVGLDGVLVEVPSVKAWRESEPAIGGDAIVVDALFGTGLSRPLGGLAGQVVAAINAAGAFVVSIDIPSGLLSSEATIPGPVVTADLTVTFARPKPAHLLPPSEMVCGQLVVVDIGIPDSAILAAGSDLHWATGEEIATLLPERNPDDHKGEFGHTLVVAGSAGKAGAAALAGWGALRSGAGLVSVATPAGVRAEVAGFAAELMTVAMPADRSGRLARASHEALLETLSDFDCVAVGPGLGQSPTVQTEIRRLVRAAPIPVVLDADGLNAFGGRHLGSLAKREAPLVMTPHPGEAARLAGRSSHEIQADRLGAARALAERCDAVCVLKGYRTIVADSDGTAVINPTGNPGMASGGMGDLLTGMVASLIAQGLEPFQAAVCAVYLHGLAADIAIADGESEAGLTASGVAECLGQAFLAVEQGFEPGEGTATCEHHGAL